MWILPSSRPRHPFAPLGGVLLLLAVCGLGSAGLLYAVAAWHGMDAPDSATWTPPPAAPAAAVPDVATPETSALVLQPDAASPPDKTDPPAGDVAGAAGIPPAPPAPVPPAPPAPVPPAAPGPPAVAPAASNAPAAAPARPLALADTRPATVQHLAPVNRSAVAAHPAAVNHPAVAVPPAIVRRPAVAAQPAGAPQSPAGASAVPRAVPAAVTPVAPRVIVVFGVWNRVGVAHVWVAHPQARPGTGAIPARTWRPAGYPVPRYPRRPLATQP